MLRIKQQNSAKMPCGQALDLGYDSSTAAFKTSGRVAAPAHEVGQPCVPQGMCDDLSDDKVSFGMPKFNAEPRRTMEGMYVRGWSGPGVGKRLGLRSGTMLLRQRHFIESVLPERVSFLNFLPSRHAHVLAATFKVA